MKKKHSSQRGGVPAGNGSSEVHDGSRGGAVRHLRLQGLLREELEGLLRDDVADPRLSDVSVTAVDLSADCRAARIVVQATSCGMAGGAPSDALLAGADPTRPGET